MKRILFAFTCIVLSFTSCDDFLEKLPQDAMSDENYFKNESDFKFYMNGLYGNVFRKVTNRPVALNKGSDDIVSDEPDASLMRHSFSGLAPLINNAWNNSYDYIRKCNYIIQNAYKMHPMTPVAQHYLGEGFFCRAFEYFELLQKFGGVPYIDKVLDTKSPELFTPRSSRDVIARKIISDLDSAIVKMDWRGTKEAVDGRLNKEAALLLKTRVALYEGSWEYFHGKKNTKFKVEGSDGKEFLQMAVEAGDELIAKQGSKIFVGSQGNEYFELFNQKDYKDIPGAFMYTQYSTELDIKHNWGASANAGFGVGLTKDAVECYLMKDGKPAEISEYKQAGPKIDDIVAVRDPRLAQTIWYPAKGLFSDYWIHAGLEFSYPGLIQSQQNQPSYTGFRLIKSASFDPSEILLNNGECDDLIYRYEEALLNYAEAKALLRTLTQADLDKTVNLLRARVHMPAMDLNDINSWTVTYSPTLGYDVDEPNIVNELRREKRVEFMAEGLRVMDLKRWAVYDDVFNGNIPLGANLKEFMDYWNAPGMKKMYRLTKGRNVNEINGFINPFFLNSDFKTANSRGYYVDPDRDYLDAIPAEEISLYMNDGNVVLEQNPGWF